MLAIMDKKEKKIKRNYVGLLIIINKIELGLGCMKGRGQILKMQFRAPSSWEMGGKVIMDSAQYDIISLCLCDSHSSS